MTEKKRRKNNNKNIGIQRAQIVMMIMMFDDEI